MTLLALCLLFFGGAGVAAAFRPNIALARPWRVALFLAGLGMLGFSIYLHDWVLHTP